MENPLKNCRIVLTRDSSQSKALSNKIESLGGQAIIFPTIRIKEPLDRSGYSRALQELGRYDWIAFSSVNAVRFFFQRVNGKVLQGLDAKIVAVMVSSDIDLLRTAAQAAEVIGDTKVIASSDFTHYGPNYGYQPFRANVKENMYSLDRKAIELITKFDTEGFLDYARNSTICGKLPIAFMMELIKGKVKKAELLKYYTSGDIADDYTNAVGYASIAFK